MKTLLAISLVAALLGLSALPPFPITQGKVADQPRPVEDAAEQSGITFVAIDITIDPQGQPLGAYQFEIMTINASFTFVGVEAGDHPAFDHGRPPYFDRVALDQDTDRLIVAEYALPNLDAARLPTQPVRVATIHVMLDKPFDPDQPPKVGLTLIAAGNADAKPIDAKASLTFRTPERPE